MQIKDQGLVLFTEGYLQLGKILKDTATPTDTKKLTCKRHSLYEHVYRVLRSTLLLDPRSFAGFSRGDLLSQECLH